MTLKMTPRLRLDHFLCFTGAPGIEAQLERYRGAGFLPHDQTARWDPGLHNGFVRLWPEYLEFLWVEDEAAFAGSKASYHSLGGAAMREVREAGRPHGIGFYSDDVPALHMHWRERGFALPEPAYWRLKTTPQDAPPDFAYQEMPDALLPGTACFALTSYYPDAPMRREAWVAPNSVYALSGVTFVADDPTGRARLWRDLLAPERELAEGAFFAPPHRLRWLSPAAYEREVGAAWRPAPHAYGELALLHLLAEDLSRLEAGLMAAGWEARRLGPALFVPAHPEDGFAFVVTERPAEEWLAERTATTGERLELKRAAPH